MGFTDEQRQWLDAIKDHIAACLRIPVDDPEDSPFNQFGGLKEAGRVARSNEPLPNGMIRASLSMTTFLFWNLIGKEAATWPARAPNLQSCVCRMALALEVDVLLFAEAAWAPAELVAALNALDAGVYCYPESNSRRIPLYTRFSASAVVDRFNDSSDGRLTIRRLTTPGNTELHLATLHFQSQMYWSRDAQALQATSVHQDIVDAEDLDGHRRTVLVGDLNMNPFDLGLICAQGLNAVMARDLARSEERTVAGKNYRLFYNPTWGCFGDRTPGPPGSYFSSAASPDSSSWHVFDQVLLRPDLMDSLSELRIVDNDGQEPLVTDRGRPRSNHLTDHLPVLFRLAI